MEEAEVVAAEEATNPEVVEEEDTKEVDTNNKAINIMTRTMVAGETRAVREEVDMAAVLKPVDGAIDRIATGITTSNSRMILAEIIGVRAEVALVANLAETKVHPVSPTMEAQTSDLKLQDHQEAMHQSLDRTMPNQSKMHQAAAVT